MAKGERTMVPLIAHDRRGRRSPLATFAAPSRSYPCWPRLRTFIESTLTNGIHVAWFPSTLRSVRGGPSRSWRAGFSIAAWQR